MAERTEASPALLSPEELKAIRERESKATPGPWRVAGPREPEAFVEGQILCTEDALVSTERVIAETNYHFTDGDDQQFIAHARNDIPRLLDSITALQQEVEELRRERRMLALLAYDEANYSQLLSWDETCEAITVRDRILSTPEDQQQ